jgi:predicted phage tail protein
LIDTTKFPATSQFLKQNKLFFDGAIAQPTNIRQFISDTAPFFLCAFIISNGKFSIIPAVPTESHSGAISKQPVKIQQLFTSGNIIEDSFTVEYLSTEERKNFQAVIRYRSAKRNQLPEERTLAVRWADLPETASIETFDMTQYCTSSNHAALVAKYFLSLRRRVTHTVKFRTTPYGISLAPGNYIRVVTQATPYSVANNGVVDGSGNITSVTPLADGVYNVSYWNSSFDDLKTENMTVASGKAVEPKFANSIFAVVDATVSSGTYMVEQLSLSEEGLVDIVAVQFPTTDTFNSLIALDLLNDSAFTFEGDYAVS